MRSDLHIHTTASDGTWEPARLIAEVKRQGIEVFAVTDHDTVANLTLTARLAGEAGLRFVPGVEISTTYEGRLFHILGYGIDPDNPSLRQLLSHNTRLMTKKDDDSIKMLIEEGAALDFESYLAYDNDYTRGGWKALNFLIDSGLCNDAADFFTRLFKGLHHVFPVFPPPREVTEIIKQAGGIAVLAHPAGSFSRKMNLESVLASFCREGIEGVEVFHPDHDQEKTVFCRDWSLQKGLYITGGSDCHGDFIESRRLGTPEVRMRQLSFGKIKDTDTPRSEDSKAAKIK